MRINPTHYETSDDLQYSKKRCDLHPLIGLSIRKNIANNSWEIFNIDTDVMIYSGTLEYIVDMANKIEGGKNISIEN